MENSHPVIHLDEMSQRAQVLGRMDDWTGITSTAERRKRQNRLNSRAFRRRLKDRRQCVEGRSHAPYQTLGVDDACGQAAPDSSATQDSEVPHWSERHQAVIHLARPETLQRTEGRPVLPCKLTPTILSRILFPLCPDNLLTLIQYNVLRASMTNRDLVSRIMPQTNDWSPTQLVTTPKLRESAMKDALPRSLWPTGLQHSVKHFAWIDILPHPVLRDNMIRVTTDDPRFADHDFDQDLFWQYTIGGLFSGNPPLPTTAIEDGDTDFSGGIVWSPPWDASGWEFSPGFWRRYKRLFRGCEAEVLWWTNAYRTQRGENRIEMKD